MEWGTSNQHSAGADRYRDMTMPAVMPYSDPVAYKEQSAYKDPYVYKEPAAYKEPVAAQKATAAPPPKSAAPANKEIVGKEKAVDPTKRDADFDMFSGAPVQKRDVSVHQQANEIKNNARGNK